MNNQERIAEIIYLSYKNINFTSNFKERFLKYNFPLDAIMTRMDKKENLRILKSLDYNFKISSPGQYYDYTEEFGNIKLILSCQISGGIITSYIYIYANENKIDSNYYRANLTFVYRHLVGDMNTPTNAFKFRNFEDFRNAMSDILGIYEDFKTEFLRLLEENGLLE